MNKSPERDDMDTLQAALLHKTKPRPRGFFGWVRWALLSAKRWRVKTGAPQKPGVG